MMIGVGDRLPEATFRVLGSEGIEKMTTSDIFSGRKVVVFAVPGAFTP
ncbi:MAG TPA: redoxin family protein, partial [Methyloceanibacter sp.]|nr:redoxin family protein [Methyloceanibacter sp.]